MKKLLLFFITAIISLSLFSCSDDGDRIYTFCMHTGNTEYTIPSVVYTKEDLLMYDLPDSYKMGYKFEGWYIDEECVLPFSDTLLDTEGVSHIELYAKYTLLDYGIDICDVISPASEGKKAVYNVIGTEYFYYGKSINLTIPEKEDMVFAGFYEDDSFTKPFSYTTMPAYTLQLFVKWETPPEPVCTYYFHTGTEQMISCLTIAYKDLSDSALPTPEKDGCTFEGWYTDVSLTQKFDPANADKSVEAIELFAKYSV